MRPFRHLDVESVEEACSVLRRYGRRARLNAGGTDLLALLKAEVLPRYPEVIVNIKTIPQMDYITEDDGRLRIGALARLSDIEASLIIREKYKLLSEAAHSVATPQIRHIATIGGNLCQEVRCFYFRYPYEIGGPILCARKGKGPCYAIRGDNRYHSIFGGKRCFAVCPSDMATALCALEGRVVVAGPQGEREIPIEEFYHPLGTHMKEEEMVKEVTIPRLEGAERQVFLKFTLRRPVDFAIVSVAAVITMEGTLCKGARICLGGVAPTPLRAKRAEELLLDEPLTDTVVHRAAEEALLETRPLKKNGYKIEIAKALLKRALSVI